MEPSCKKKDNRGQCISFCSNSTPCRRALNWFATLIVSPPFLRRRLASLCINYSSAKLKIIHFEHPNLIVTYPMRECTHFEVKNEKTNTKIATLLVSITVLTMLSISSIAIFGYGGQSQQYQITASENCNNPSLCGGVRSGEWGWCELGGSGTQGDCQITLYANSGVGSGSNQVHISADLTGWTIAPCTTFCTAASGNDFYFTSGTATLSGGSIRGPPVTVDLCSIGFCGDSGLPATPGL